MNLRSKTETSVPPIRELSSRINTGDESQDYKDHAMHTSDECFLWANYFSVTYNEIDDKNIIMGYRAVTIDMYSLTVCISIEIARFTIA